MAVLFLKMIVKFIVPLFMCFYLIKPNESARILGVFPMAAPSHYFLGNSLMRGLAEAGHDVTMISPFTEDNPPKNGKWRDIVLSGSFEAMMKHFSKIDVFKMESSNVWLGLFFLINMGHTATEVTLNHTEVQKLMKSNEKFDVVIVSQFVNDAMKAFANHFNAHLILFSNTGVNSWVNHLVGNPSLPSYHPEIILSLPKKMSFFQRVHNTLFKSIYAVYTHVSFYSKQNELIKKYFPNPVDIDDVLYNVSLVLLNSHPSIFNPQPMVPCMIEIGGFHIKPPKKLPEDLQIFLDNAKGGVIYFSLGSNIKSALLPIEKREAILKAFGKRKEQILWKWEEDSLPGQPPNVKLGKWLPQQDILSHPNVKVFITHGGLLSTTETVYHGVPIVAIPLMGDQKMNAYTAQDSGYAVVLPFSQLNEETLTSVLDEVINNPKYRDNVKERSRIMKDRQVKPIDNAVYWVEYVIRHNGAKHLRVPYLELTWYQFYLLDVLAFIFAVVLITTYINLLLLRKICSFFICKKGEKTKVKKN